MEIVLDKKEILRYLGYRSKQELTTEMDVQILQLMEEIKHVAVPPCCCSSLYVSNFSLS